jgi:hypothetical protein
MSGVLAQGAAYLLAWRLGPEAVPAAWSACYGTSATLAGVLVLGAARQGRLSLPATIAAVALFTIPFLGFGLAIALPAGAAAEPLLLGLPRRAAIVLLGVGVLPVAILPVAYARDAGAGLDDAALAAIRDEGARLREPPGSP